MNMIETFYLHQPGNYGAKIKFEAVNREILVVYNLKTSIIIKEKKDYTFYVFWNHSSNFVGQS